VLGAADICHLMDGRDWLEAARAAFLALAEGTVQMPPVGELPAAQGAFHLKCAQMRLGDRACAVVKINGNFPGNPQRTGLPTIQGAVLLLDAGNGQPLALIESSTLTAWRTAATSVLALQTLAAPGARRALIIGCGVQGAVHLALLRQTLALDRIDLADLDRERAEQLAQRFAGTDGCAVQAVADFRTVSRDCPLLLTCTTAREPLLRPEHVAAGSVIAAVGADNPHKQELAPELVRAARLVCDLRAQCATLGEWRHQGRDMVPAELGEILAGRVAGRRDPAEVVVFDSTGVAVQDLTAAHLLWQRAAARSSGLECEWGSET
jgi:alanine dehydrogenase